MNNTFDGDFHFVLYQPDTPSPFSTCIENKSNGRCESGDMKSGSNGKHERGSNGKHERGDMRGRSNGKNKRGDMRGRSNNKNECRVKKSSTVNFMGNLCIDPMVDICHLIYGFGKNLGFGIVTHSKSRIVNSRRCQLYEL